MLPLFGHLGTVLIHLGLNFGPTEEPKASKAIPQTLKIIEKQGKNKVFVKILMKVSNTWHSGQLELDVA